LTDALVNIATRSWTHGGGLPGFCLQVRHVVPRSRDNYRTFGEDPFIQNIEVTDPVQCVGLRAAEMLSDVRHDSTCGCGQQRVALAAAAA
jgi:hypothetical protein